MAISNDTVVAKVVAAQLLLAYRQRRVFSQRVNNTWRNALNNGGNEVLINRPVAGSVADYTSSTTVAYGTSANVNATALSLQIGGTGGIGKGGVSKYWTVKLDDLEAAMTSVGLLQASVVEYGAALADQVDDDVRSAMLATTNTVPDRTIDLDTIAGNKNGLDIYGFETMHKALDWKRVPRQGRWLIVGPAFAEAMQKSALSSEVMLSSPQTAALANGRIGTVAGFDVYLADPKHSAFTAKAGAKDPFYTETLVAGVDSATAFIDRIRKTERLRLEESFADAVRGLYQYNAAIIQSDRILKASYKIEGAGVTQLALPTAVTA